MRTTQSALFLACVFPVIIGLLVPKSADADYAMPPMETVLKTVPIIVDATVTRIEPKSGTAHLEIHRAIRGTDAKRLVVSKTALSCTGGGPGVFGAVAGKRYVFLLEAEDTVYEETTFYLVVGDGEKPDLLRIQYPHPIEVGKHPEITFEKFAELITPDTEKDVAGR